MARKRPHPLAVLATVAIVVCISFEIWARFFAVFDWHADPFDGDQRNVKNFSIVSALEKSTFVKHGYRIVVTGGSVAYGWGASDQAHRFPAVLETKLRAALHRNDIEVINAGVPDFTAADEVALYSQKVRSMNPDLVIMFTGFNDLWDTLKYALTDRPSPGLARTFQHRVIGPTQSLELLRAFARSVAITLDQQLAKLSKGYEWLRKSAEHRSYKPIANLSSFHEEAGCDALEGFVDDVVTLQTLTKRHGEKLLVVFQPVRFLADVSQSQFPISRYERVLKKMYRDCLFPKLTSYASQSGLALVDSNPELSRELIAKKAYFDFCHVNDEGNEMIASYVAGKIRKLFFN